MRSSPVLSSTKHLKGVVRFGENLFVPLSSKVFSIKSIVLYLFMQHQQYGISVDAELHYSPIQILTPSVPSLGFPWFNFCDLHISNYSKYYEIYIILQNCACKIEHFHFQ